MTDPLPGLGLTPATGRKRSRCHRCHRPVYADQLVFGHGRDCAEQRGLIVNRHKFAARPPGQTDTLLDHLENTMVTSHPTVRLDATGMTPDEAHVGILDRARASAAVAAQWRQSLPEVFDSAVAACEGIVRILERHAPYREHTDRVIICDRHSGDTPTWPCGDYLDAAAGFTIDLDRVSY